MTDDTSNRSAVVSPETEAKLRSDPEHVREVLERAALEAYATLAEALDWGARCGNVNFLRLPLRRAADELFPVVRRLG